MITFYETAAAFALCKAEPVDEPVAQYKSSADAITRVILEHCGRTGAAVWYLSNGACAAARLCRVEEAPHRAMAVLLAIFAVFERVILRERTHAGLARGPGKTEN